MTADFPFKPRVAGWELTLRCNMSCIHCGSAAGDARPGELSEAEGLDLIEQLLELGLEVLTLSGGEPLLHPSWPVYAKRLTAAGVKTYMITNGLVLKQNISRLLEAGIRRVGISFDGTAATHDFIRNRAGSFDAAMAAARAAKREGLSVGAVTHVSKPNFGELEAMYALFAEVPLDFWQIQITFRQGRMRQHDDLAIEPQQLPEIARFIHAKQQLSQAFQVTPGDNMGYYCDPPIRTHPWKGCFAGRHLIGIDADGAIKGCLSLPREFIEGNVREERLRQIWEDPERFKYNRYFAREQLTGSCKDCPKGIPCRAGCTVTAYSATGERFHNPYCVYRFMRGESSSGESSSGESR